MIKENKTKAELLQEIEELQKKIKNLNSKVNKNPVYEDENEATINLIRLMNAKNNLYEFMQAIIVYLKKWTGCEAIGIRLKDGNDYPYYITQGFTDEFVQDENKLCAGDLNGQLIEEGIGNPVLECMCGNILAGRFDPKKPFFTENGSFWTNSTTDLLATTTEADRQSRTRNRCNGEGYESVALIPLKFKDTVFGLMQLNDKRKNRFNKKLINTLERLSSNIAIGLAQRKSAEKLEEREKRFRTIIESTEAGYFFIDKDGFFREVNDAWARLYHYDSADEIIGKHFKEFQTDEDAEKAKEFVYGIMNGDANYTKGEFSRRCKDGTTGYHTFSAKPVINLGKVIGIEGFIIDSTERKLAEASIRKSEEKYRLLAEKSNALICETDKEGKFLYVNSSFKNILGYEPEELLGKTPFDIGDPSEKNDGKSKLVKAGNINDAQSNIWKFYDKNKNLHYLNCFSNTYKNPAGQLIINTIAFDITEHKLAEEMLKQALDIARLGPWEYDVIKDEFTFNDHLYLIFKTTAEKEGGYKMSSKEYSSRFVHPDDAPLVGKKILEAVETDDPDFNDKIEHRILYADGNTGYISVHFFVVKDSNGKTVKTYGVNQDITERKIAEEALKFSENKFRNYIEHAPDGIFILDESSRFTDANNSACRITGYSLEEIKKLSLNDLLAEESKEEGINQFKKIMKTGAAEIDLWYIHKDGSKYCLTANAVKLSEKRILCFAKDITERKRTEVALLESESRLRAMFESSRDAIGVSKKGIHIYANPAYIKLFGYENNEQIIGTSILDSISPTSHKQVLQNIQDRAEGEQIQTFYEARGRKIDGTEFDMEVNVSTYELNEEIYSLAIIRDITERKQIEKALEKSEEKFSKAFKTSAELITIISIDEGKYIDVNDAFLKKTGYKKEDIIGYTSAELNIWVDMKDRQRFMEELFKKGTMNNFEIQYRMRNQEIRDFSVSSEIIELEGIKCSLSFILDVTEQKKAEKELQATKDYLENLIDTANAIILGLDINGNITVFNKAAEKITGYTRKELENKNWFEVIVPKERYPEVWMEYKRLLKGGYPKTFENPILTKSKEERYITWQNSELFKNGKFGGTISFGIDITERMQMEKSLQESEIRHREMIANISDVIAIIGKDGVLNYISPNIEEKFGWKPEEVAGTSSWSRVHPDDLERIRNEFSLFLENYNMVRSVEFNMKCKDGSFKPVELTAINLINDPVINGILMNYHDITDRKLAIEAIKLSEERFRMLFQNLTVGFALHEMILDENNVPIDYRFLEINPAFENITGLKASEIIGKTAKEVLPGLENYWLEIYGKVAVSGVPFHFENFSKDLNRHYEVAAYSPKKGQFAVITSDITERKMMEIELLKSEDRFRKLVQSVTDYIYTVKVENGEPVSTVHGPACISVTGYSSEEFAKDPYLWYNIIHKDDQYKVVKELNNILTGELVKHFEHRIIHKVGSIRWVKNTVVVLRNEKGEVTEYDGLIVDITEKKLAEEEILKLNIELEARVQERTAELASANKELEAFSYSVSHDLKAPLRAVSGFSELALKEFKKNTGNNILGFLEKINFASLKMASLIDDLLNLSRISQAAVNKTTFNICSVSRTTMDDLRSQNPQRKVKYIQPEEIMVNADLNLVRIALFNLLGNAWKYTSKKIKANIEFGVKKTDDNIIFFVKDNGDGFDMKYSDKLFSPFQRLHASNEFEGTGIGLSIVKRIISKHNGRIWAESKKGIGTIIYFTLGKD